MITPTRLLAASATAGVLTLALTSIAAATPVTVTRGYNLDVGSTRWSLDFDEGLEIEEGTIFDGAAGAPGTNVVNSDAFDGVLAVWIRDGGGTTYYGGAGAHGTPFVADITTTSEGDVVVQGPAESHSGLDVALQYRFYADGDLARALVTLTNPTSAPITVATGTYSNLGSDNDTHLDAESSGNGVVDTSDRWMVTDQAGTANQDPVITTAWAGPDSGTPLTAITVSPGYVTTEVQVTVDPRATVTLAYFIRLSAWTIAAPPPPSAPPSAPPSQDQVTTDVAAAVTIASDKASAVTAAVAGVSELGAFSGRLTAGIPAGTRVLNWGTVGGATPPTPATPAAPVVGKPRFTG